MPEVQEKKANFLHKCRKCRRREVTSGTNAGSKKGENMAITKLNCIKSAEESGREASEHLYNALRYIANPEKTQGGRFVGGLNVLPDWKSAYDQMMMTKKFYGKTDMRQGYHFILSFLPEEHVPAELAFQITKEFCEKYLGDQYECLYSVHDDRPHTHGHIVFNSVNLQTGLKYHYKAGDWRKYIQPITNELCAKYGLQTIKFEGYFEDGELHEGRKQNLSHQDSEALKSGAHNRNAFLRVDLDAAVDVCETWDQLIMFIEARGWTVNDKRKDGGLLKYFSVINKSIGMEQYMRPDRWLGEAYSREGLIARMQGLPVIGAEGVGTSGTNAGSGGLEDLEKWDWKKAYRNDRWKDYQAQRAPLIKKGYRPSGYKATLTDYQRRYFRLMYQTEQMAHLKANRVPIDWRNNVLHLREIQEETNYVIKHNIRQERDIDGRKEALRKELGEVNDELRELYQMRYGTKEAMAFSFALLREAGRPIPESYIATAKNLERQELAGKLLEYLRPKAQAPEVSSEALRAKIHALFETGGYVVETEESFLKYLFGTQKQKGKGTSCTNAQSLKEKLELIYYSKRGLRQRRFASYLLSDRPETMEELKGRIESAAEEYGCKAKDFEDISGMDDLEEAMEALYRYVLVPEKNTKALDYIEVVRTKQPERFAELIGKVLAESGSTEDMLKEFGEEFKHGEKALQKRKREIKAEWKLLEKLRRERLVYPAARRTQQDRTDKKEIRL